MEWVKTLDEREGGAPNEFVERWVLIINELAESFPVQSKLAEALNMEYKQFREVYEFRKQVFNVDFLRHLVALDKRVNPYFVLFGIGPVFFDRFPFPDMEKKLDALVSKKDTPEMLVSEPDLEGYVPMAKQPGWRKQLAEQEHTIQEQKRIISALTDYIELLKAKK